MQFEANSSMKNINVLNKNQNSIFTPKRNKNHTLQLDIKRHQNEMSFKNTDQR